MSHSPKQIKTHDEWNPKTREYDADIAILEFETGKIYINADSTFIQPICLWSAAIEPSVTVGTVTGWGKSEDPSKNHEMQPKLINVPIQTNSECIYGERSLFDLTSSRTFCAGLKNGSGTCFGDSGGGLFIKVDGVYYLKGIVSSSLVKNENCDISRSTVYTDVLKFMDFIFKETRGALGYLTKGLI